MGSTSNQTITVAITSTANNPDDLSYTITGSGSTDTGRVSGGSNVDTNTGNNNSNNNAGTGNLTGGNQPPGNNAADRNAVNNNSGAENQQTDKICASGAKRACTTGLKGACAQGIQTCSDNKWGVCAANALAGNEICSNSLDDDCDGKTDSEDSDCKGLVAQVADKLTGKSPISGILLALGGVTGLIVSVAVVLVVLVIIYQFFIRNKGLKP